MPASPLRNHSPMLPTPTWERECTSVQCSQMEASPLFTIAPQLGGSVLMRGYLRDRFRNRALTLLSAEYSFPITDVISGYLFIDAGEVWNDLQDIDLVQAAVGFGGGRPRRRACCRSPRIARSAMSSLRSRSGGTEIRSTFSR